ncbi:MAG TPA: FAD-dependent oxidoreductase [Candidatus Cloacimonadota bacterium]|nr:FAD-dependent oxidoreductase [Candidatus Cloacimonadota bacterium]HQL14350.1 FAD-dependent oxidoreductase [Candidatus Cloacimonadota bacterium]
MAKIEVILNGEKMAADTEMTILDLAKRQGIKIPTLCHDEELKPYGSCWVCAVEVKGRKGFVTSCGTYLTDGMDITTDSEEIHQARKMALELLVSDHYADCVAPCKIACPAQVDVQTYVSLIANGQYHEAVRVIKETLPMPLSIGRVCPAFCEKECRRQLVEEPVAIRQLKRFAADNDLNDFWNYVPEKQPPKGKKVAIIGAGPSGLTCGYYLSNLGYEVDVFEAAPAAGGWLRYGIPEYRLPKAVLEREIELMCSNGMKILTGKTLGRDIFLEQLSKDYDAVYVAIGAQKAVPMPVKGSDLEGCYLGADFLKAHALGQTPKLGKKVAIIGGGNTAIDCARTCVRLGAQVTIIYRRTRDEMPAEDYEIDAAESEGVTFYMLSNPVEYIGENGCLHTVRIEKMKLGEPDNSGRRRPEPTGEFFTEQFDNIIAAISQVPDVEIFAQAENNIDGEVLPISRWSTAIVNEDTMFTGLANVFAGGDFRRGAATAVEAIADGRLAAEMIERFLQGEEIQPSPSSFVSKKGEKIREVSKKEYEQIPVRPREEMPEIALQEAKSGFREVEKGFPLQQAKTEAERCLECGCQVNETCFLRKYATDYKVDATRFWGSQNHHPIDASHPFILRDANKCIKCGRCVRTCAEVQGAAVLGYIYRGFPTLVAPEFGNSLTETTCEACGKCINVCPVGALTERNLHYKLNPHPRQETIQSCGLCGTGCSIKVQAETDKIALITTPESEDEPLLNNFFNGRNLCFQGRFGWQILFADDRLKQPMIKEGANWNAIEWAEAGKLMKEKAKKAKQMRLEVTPFATLEEMLVLKQIAENKNAVLSSNGCQSMFSDELWPEFPSAVPYEQLENFRTYVIIGKISHTLRTLIRLRQRQGAKLILVNPPDEAFNKFADVVTNDLGALDADKDTLFVYNINQISEAEAFAVWEKARKITGITNNVLMTSDFPNLAGMSALGIKPDETAGDFVLSYGAYPEFATEDAFKIAVVPFLEENAPVDLLLPQPSYLEIEGTAIANAGIVTHYKNPAQSKFFSQFLKLCYEAEWISPALAETAIWNRKAENLLCSSKSILQPHKLNTQKREMRNQLKIRLDSLYDLRHQKQNDYPYKF